MTEDDDGPTDATVNERPRGTPRPSTGKLAGRYRIVEQLGKGGMGEVLLAIDVTLNREVAIKRMLTPDPSESQVARFLREARVQGRLEHSAIAPVYELSRDVDGRPFFVMKRLSGTTLADIIDDNAEGYTLQRLLRAFTEVCHAVELAHSRGVIHRDLKPSNIMLGDFGEVYVLDWGVAKVTGDQELADILAGATSTMPGVVIGTKPYMPPEQQAGIEIDHRIDVYALG
ncbi:MAG TPA: serine/threonine-protein kinase, partial [Kofleriaceae bacterium]|nr:serine/threonine-protein kinase [Kofleriaceae bacterium]